MDEITFSTATIRPGATVSEHVVVCNNNGHECLLSVGEARIVPSGVTFPEEAATLPANSKHTVLLEFTPTFPGVTRTVLTFKFSSTNPSSSTTKTAAITRRLSFRSGDPDAEDYLKPKSPYVRPRKSKGDDAQFNNEIPVKKPRSTLPPFLYELLPYKPSARWRWDLAVHNASDILAKLTGNPKRGGGSSAGNYRELYEKLLWTEEVQMEKDIKMYDIERATMTRKRPCFFSLHCPGLAEARPSVMRGDLLTLSLNGVAYQGYVDGVDLEHATLKTPPRFDSAYVQGASVGVRFRFKRLPLQTSHQAIENCVSVMGALFPLPFGDPSRVTMPSRQNAQHKVQHKVASPAHFYNKTLNVEQQAAVNGVLGEVCRPSPYLIYGPPVSRKGEGVCRFQTDTLTLQQQHTNSSFLLFFPLFHFFPFSFLPFVHFFLSPFLPFSLSPFLPFSLPLSPSLSLSLPLSSFFLGHGQDCHSRRIHHADAPPQDRQNSHLRSEQQRRGPARGAPRSARVQQFHAAADGVLEGQEARR